MSVVATSAKAVALTPAVASVHVGDATGGTFTLSVDVAGGGAEETDAIAFDAAAAAVKSALDANTNVVTSVVTGTGVVSDPWIITITNPAGPVVITGDGSLLEADSAVVTVDTPGVAAADTVVTIHVEGATDGTWIFTADGESSDPIDFDADDATVEAAVEAMDAVTSATVTGAGELADPWIITIDDPAGPIAGLGADFSGLRPYGLETHLGDGDVGFERTTAGVVGVGQVVTIDLGDGADADGTWVATVDGDDTSPLAHDVSGANLETALEGLSSVTACAVVGDGPYAVTFSDPIGPLAVSAAGVDLVVDTLVLAQTNDGANLTPYIFDMSALDPGIEKVTVVVTTTGKTGTSPTLDFAVAWGDSLAGAFLAFSSENALTQHTDNGVKINQLTVAGRYLRLTPTLGGTVIPSFQATISISG